jgi:predicted outer membrane repeat protein
MLNMELDFDGAAGGCSGAGTPESMGAALLARGWQVSVTGGTWQNNKACAWTQPGGVAPGYGGAIYFDTTAAAAPSLTVKSVVFRGNQAWKGGGIYMFKQTPQVRGARLVYGFGLHAV